MPPQKAKIDTAEELLLDYAERVAYHRRGRVALWIRLSRLQPSGRPEARQNLVFQLFHTLLGRFSGQSFALKNGDVVFAFKGSAQQAFDEPLYRLRYSFRDDPAVIAEDEDGQSRIAESYDIEAGHEPFLAAVRAAIRPSASTERAEPEKAPKAEGGPLESGVPQGLREAVLTAGQIRDMNRAGFEVEDAPRKAERQIDLATLWRTEDFAKGLRALLRWRPAVRLAYERQGQGQDAHAGIGREVFRILDLPREPARDLVMPGLELAGNPALLAYANAQVERGVLRLLTDYLVPGGPALIVPLSLDTLLSAEFLELDRAIMEAEEAGRERPRLCFTVTEAEIDENPDSFAYAHAFLERGAHRLALAGVPANRLTHFSFETRPVDFLLLEAPPDILASEDPSLILELRHAIGRLGRERLVLARCESEAQVAFGRRLGLCLFEGPAALEAGENLREAARGRRESAAMR